MNCPNCGAENEAEAHFCAECGTPLDDVVVETAKVEQVFDDTSEDMTILSTPSEAAAEAKTLAVDQAKVVATVEEGDDAETGGNDDVPSEPESLPTPSTPSPAAGGGDQNGDKMGFGGGDSNGGSNNRTLIIVGVIVLVLLLLCCCCSVLIGAAIGSDPNAIENLMREISWLPVNLSFV